MAAVVTKYGFQETAKLLTNNGSPVAFATLAVGTGSIAEDTTVSAMSVEVTASGLARASAATVTIASSATANDTAKYSHTWTATGSYNIAECGVLNASSGGALLCYATFASAIPMASADTLQITWSNIRATLKRNLHRITSQIRGKLNFIIKHANPELSRRIYFFGQCVETRRLAPILGEGIVQT